MQLLVHLGLNNCQIQRTTGISRATVRAWRQGRTPHSARRAATSCSTCGHPKHELQALPCRAYVYLLGLYLGDGCISSHPRGVHRLRIVLDERYPGIIAEAERAIASVIGRSASRTAKEGCWEIGSYSRQWPCLFPQHGPGKKHLRTIRLADWQQTAVEGHEGALVRGLIHSDGWRGVNRVTVRGKRYAYPRYNFSNKSEDILGIFCDACDALGVEWRRMNAVTISVAKRASVARLDEFVGPKA